MSSSPASAPQPDPPTPTAPRHARKAKLRTSLSAYGEPMVWLTGGALTICLLMIIGLLVLIVWAGTTTFWPKPIAQLTLVGSDAVVLGQATRHSTYEPEPSILETMPEAQRTVIEAAMHDNEGLIARRLYRTGNKKISRSSFDWINVPLIAEQSSPAWATKLERLEWGPYYGYPIQFIIDDEVVAEAKLAASDAEYQVLWEHFETHHGRIRDNHHHIKRLQDIDLGRISHRNENQRIAVREVELELNLLPSWATAYRDRMAAEYLVKDLDAAIDTFRAETPDAEDSPILARMLRDRDHATDTVEAKLRLLNRIESSAKQAPSAGDIQAFHDALVTYYEVLAQGREEQAEIMAEINRLEDDNARYALVMQTADGQFTSRLELSEIVRAVQPNQLSFGGKVDVYLSRWWEFLTDDPREANSEGGVWPAIVGTVLMTMIMAVLVVPFGVLGALYLREYAKAGFIVSSVRIAINNLAGVPSIVFGVFGLGFFCYGVGGFIDGGPGQAALPRTEWFWLLGGLVALAAIGCVIMLRCHTKPGEAKSSFKQFFSYIAGGMWLVASLGALFLIATTPFFDGFYRASLPNPTFGKGALIWASFTLALLTLPVVIVATEEALAAVPNSMREGSYACGASKWQTIKRIVLPRAMPGIMTGSILAMARGAGEVAPLMLVGAVKLAPDLPIDHTAPFVHPDRSFMHLGFHIYDLGFQSPDSEAAKPLVFTTTLLLIALVTLLNIAAIWLRSKLRRKFVGSQF